VLLANKPSDNFVEGTFTRATGGPVMGIECQTVVIGWHSPIGGMSCTKEAGFSPYPVNGMGVQSKDVMMASEGGVG